MSLRLRQLLHGTPACHHVHGLCAQQHSKPVKLLMHTPCLGKHAGTQNVHMAHVRTLRGCDPSRMTDTYLSSPNPRLKVASPPRPLASAMLRMHPHVLSQSR